LLEEELPTQEMAEENSSPESDVERVCLILAALVVGAELLEWRRHC